MRDMLEIFGIIVVALLIYRFRAFVFGPFQRFDSRVIARRREELADRNDHLAHYKHTLRLAEEQVDEVTEITMPDERTAEPVKRYLFAGERFATREDAEAARGDAIRAIARGFYMDLPRALTERRKNKLEN
jgi:hypothetical protein